MGTMEYAQNILNKIFDGASFIGYEFDTSFTLKFSRTDVLEIGENKIKTVKINILADWLINTKEEWEACKKSFELSDVLEENEPVQAFFLTMLRWSELSQVNRVLLSSESLILELKNGKRINISNKDVYDYAWTIEEVEYNVQTKDWSIVAENNKVFLTGL